MLKDGKETMMEYGFYGCTTHKQALKRIKPLARYNMVDLLSEDAGGGFNANEIQEWLRKYHLKNSMKLLEMFMEKTEKERIEAPIDKDLNVLLMNGVWSIAYLMRCKPYWKTLVADLMKHYSVEFDDYQDVCKGLSLVAWFMANDHERAMAESETQDTKESEYHGYITQMALSCACEILGTRRNNKREEAKLKKDLIFVGQIAEELNQEIKN